MSICCCARVAGVHKILLDSGQMTCESFKSFKSIGLELEDVVLLTSASVNVIFDDESTVVKFIEDFDCDFRIDEVDEDFSVDGFAGTTKVEIDH